MTRRGLFRLFGGAAAAPVAAVLPEPVCAVPTWARGERIWFLSARATPRLSLTHIARIHAMVWNEQVNALKVLEDLRDDAALEG